MKLDWHALLLIIAILCHYVAGHVGIFDQSNTTSNINGKTLMLVIEATTQNAAAVNTLVANASFLDGLNQEWFSRYVIVAFDSTGVTLSVATHSPTEVYALLSLIANTPTSNNDCFLQLSDYVTSNPYFDTLEPQSIVYVITTAGLRERPNKLDFSNAKTGYFGKIQLQYIFINATACQSNGTYHDSVMSFANMATSNNGNFIKLTPGEVGTFLRVHLPTLYNTKLIGDASYDFICPNTVFHVTVESDDQIVYLYSISNAIPVVSMDMNFWALLVPTNIVFDDGYTRILSFTPESLVNYTVALAAYGDCYMQLRFQYNTKPLSTSTIAPTTSLPLSAIPVDVALMLDVGGDVPKTLRDDLRIFLMNALSPFDIGWQNNFHVAIFNVFGDDMNTAFETHGFDNIANQNELDRYLNLTYQDGNSTRGGQSALKDGFISVNYDDGYRPDINNHLIIYVTTNGTADAAAVSAAMSIISSGKYSVAAVAYDANGSNTVSLTSLVGGKAECVITANDPDDLTITAAEKLTNLIWKASNNNGAYC